MFCRQYHLLFGHISPIFTLKRLSFLFYTFNENIYVLHTSSYENFLYYDLVQYCKIHEHNIYYMVKKNKSGKFMNVLMMKTFSQDFCPAFFFLRAYNNSCPFHLFFPKRQLYIIYYT
jgi:hypothetical protein